MSFFKIDLQEEAWLDEVFLSRNKAYGAFQIRKSYSQNAVFGLIWALSSFTLMLCLPLLIHAMGGEKPRIIMKELTLLSDYKLPDIVKPPVDIKRELPKSIRSTIQSTPPVITQDDKVKIHEIPRSNLDLTDKNIGSKTQEGNDSIGLDIPDEPKNGSGEIKSNEPDIEISPEFPAEYPGGYDALSADVSFYLKSHYPQAALDDGVSGKVILNFVVEKDGSVDLIQILKGKDLGAGLPEVAIKAVEHLKKFHPGKQNGHLVRQYFSFPITFQTQNNE